jgi:hypothetical protein
VTSFKDRILRAAKLDADLYEEVEAEWYCFLFLAVLHHRPDSPEGIGAPAMPAAIAV